MTVVGSAEADEWELGWQGPSSWQRGTGWSLKYSEFQIERREEIYHYIASGPWKCSELKKPAYFTDSKIELDWANLYAIFCSAKFALGLSFLQILVEIIMGYV